MAKRSSKKGSKKESNKRSSSKNSIDLDFTGVESRVANYTIPDGTYTVKVTDVEKQESNDKPDAMIVSFEVSKGKQKGFKFNSYMATSEAALFRIQQFLEAFQIDYKEEGKFKLDLKELKGIEGEVELKAQERNGYTNMNVVRYLIEDDEEDEDDDDDYEDDDEDDEDYDDDEEDDVEAQLNDLKKSQLKEVAEFLDINAKKIKKAKGKDDLIELILDEDEEDIEDAIEELDE